MKTQTSAGLLLSAVLCTALAGPSPSAVVAADQPAATPVQYGPYPDRRDYQDRYYPGDRRDDYRPYPPPRGSYNGPLWRPGDVVPPDVLDFVVDDWEPRGLERPPGGHLWFRVGYQFLLVRERDRMISRVINFD